MAAVLSTLASVKLFAILAVTFQMFGLLSRNELWLRLLLLAGGGFYIVYYMNVGDAPLWEAIFASSLLLLANLYALVFILLDRSTLGMGPEMRELYTHFPTFNPGQFRRIMRHAAWCTAEGDEVLCREGVVPEGLYFFLEGSADLERSAKSSSLPVGRFVGEMSFLRGAGHGANATVTVRAGSRYVKWDRAALQRQADRHLPLRNAINALFNRDLLQKLDRSWPEQ